jgi:hypothetical protein
VAEHPAGEAEVLGDRQGGEHALAAGHERQAEAGGLLGRKARDVAPVERGAPRARRQQAGDRLEYGRLAGAVGAQERDQLVALDPQVDAEQHLQRADDASMPSQVSRWVPRRSRRTLPTLSPGPAASRWIAAV